MADYIANFGAQVSKVTAPSTYGSNSGGNGSSLGGNVTVSKPSGLFGRFFGETHLEVTPTTARPPKPNRVVNVYDGDASAGSQIMGTNVESYRISEGGGKVFAEKIGTSIKSLLGL